MTRIYPQTVELSTWQNLFALYRRNSSLAPSWFGALSSGSQSPTGSVAVDASLLHAWSSWPGREGL